MGSNWSFQESFFFKNLEQGILKTMRLLDKIVENWEFDDPRWKKIETLECPDE